MATGVLRDELLSLPGVERADLDGAGPSPTGIRVRLGAGVDPILVGEQVRRVLAAHGLRSEVVGGSADVVQLPTESAAVTIDDTDPIPVVSDPPTTAAAPPVHRDDRAPAVSEVPSDVGTALDAVAVVEGREGTTITVSGSGGAASVRAASASRPAVDQAVVSAVARLAGGAPPLIRSIDERDIGDTTVATVVVDAGGERLVGSAVVGGGWSYALGRAAWAAFLSRAASGGIS